MKENTESGRDIPLGLGMALEQNADAMQCFSSLSETQRQSVINRAQAVRSKREMQALVADLGAKN